MDVIGLILAAMLHVLKGFLSLLNVSSPTSRPCEILQNWMILFTFLVLATCHLLAVWTRTTNQLRCFRLFFKPSASSFDNNHTLRSWLLSLFRKRSVSLATFVVPSSLTDTQRAKLSFKRPMSQTLTAIAHPFASKVIPVEPRIWQREIIPYWLQARRKGNTSQVQYQKVDDDFPSLKSPKRPQPFPSSKQPQASPPPKASQWDRKPPLLGLQEFRIKKHKRVRYTPPVPLDTPVIPDRPVETRVKQPYEAFLVLDIEGTCELGTDFNYPNEIIVGDHLQ